MKQPNVLDAIRLQIPGAQEVVRAADNLLADLDDLTPEGIRADPATFLKITREQVAHARHHADQFIQLAGMYERLVEIARSEGVRDGGTAAIAGMLSAAKPATRLQDAVRGAIRPANDKPRARP